MKTDPILLSMHASLVEVTLRLNRVERELGLHDRHEPLATFAQRTSLAPTPDYASHVSSDPEPCGCDESVALRSRIAKLEDDLARLAVA